MKKALITGASSGIGKDIAYELAKRGFSLILVARNVAAMEQIKDSVGVEVKIIGLDLSKSSNCLKLYEMVKEENIDILINNAGFGLCGEFKDTDLGQELDIINVNIKSVHILTKLFLKDFIIKKHGCILNVASAAAFLPGPLMATYYASKAYVLRLTNAIKAELEAKQSKVYIGVLCPGPVDTNFNNVAKVKFAAKPLSSKYVAKYAIDNMFKNKHIIIPGLSVKLGLFFSKFMSINLLSKVAYRIQSKK